MNHNQNQPLGPLSPSDWETCLNGLALLAQCFWPPEAELVRDLTAGRALEDLRRLAEIIGPSAGREVGLISDYAAAAESSLSADLEAAYVRLFGAARGGVTAPPYQSCYENEGLLMGRPAEMMADRLAAIDLDPAGSTAEPPDHLAVELEYLFLILEAALAHNRPADLTEAVRFAETEMSPWLARFSDRLAAETQCPFYPALARLVRATTEFIASFSVREQIDG